MAIVITLLTLGLLIRDGILDPKYRDRFLLKYIPELGWQIWLIIGISAFLILLLESGYSKARQDKLAFQDRYKKRFRELRREHRAELSSKQVQDLIDGQRIALTGIQGQSIIEELSQHFEIAKLQPNVRCSLIGEVISVHEGQHGEIIEGTNEQGRNFHALIVSYYNRVGAQTSSQSVHKPGVVNDVSGAITYKYLDGTGPGLAVHRGAWLSERKNQVNFGRNDKRSLVIATLEEPHQVYAIERQFDGTHQDGMTKRTCLTGALVGIHVRLIAESEGKVVNNYDAILEIEREPSLKVVLTGSLIWKTRQFHGKIMAGYHLTTQIYDIENENRFTDEVKNRIVEEVRDWETKAANFVGLHLSEEHKMNFLSSHPSIEDGLNGKRRLPRLSPRIGSLAQPAEQEYTPPYWTLHDSIKARIDKLEAFSNSLTV